MYQTCISKEKKNTRDECPWPYLFRLLGKGKELENFTAPFKSSLTTMSTSLFCRTLECLQTPLEDVPYVTHGKYPVYTCNQPHHNCIPSEIMLHVLTGLWV